MIRKVRHLVRRFVEMGRPVTSEAVDTVYAAERLSTKELRLWRMMDVRDRRHSVEVARRFLAAFPAATGDEIAAALLHDVGKSAVHLGRFGRSVATILPLTRSMIIYRDHERLGARMLAEVGASRRTIELVSGEGNDDVAAALRNADDA